MCTLMCQTIPNCTKENAIPDSVLIDILSVYQFGTKEGLANAPNNLVCQRDGSFWTTGDRIFEVRSNFKLRKKKNDRDNLP